MIREIFRPLPMSRMSLMKLLCAFLVVVIHAKFSIDDHMGIICYNMVSEGICRIAVPFFFFAAGYFLSRHMGEPGWWWRELRKRLRSVLIPGVVFLLAYIAIAYTLFFLRGGARLIFYPILALICVEPRSLFLFGLYEH